MDVNKITIRRVIGSEQEIVIPIQTNYDFLDRTSSIIEYEKKAIKESINQVKDFEIARFEHSKDTTTQRTDINYNFFFVNSSSNISNAVWENSYLTQGFTPNEVYYYSDSFKRSFFKLDLYDTTNQKKQTNYLTLIIPVQQGFTTGATVGYQQQQIKMPKFKLDFLGDKEGFFIYWLKKKDFLDINTFYMTAKFFDAKNGVFVKMMNRPQSTLLTNNKFNFNQELYYYYKIILNYSDYTYKVYDINTGTDILTGAENNPINWYEYINP